MLYHDHLINVSRRILAGSADVQEKPEQNGKVGFVASNSGWMREAGQELVSGWDDVFGLTT